MPDVGIENEIISIVITMLVMINMALNKSKVKQCHMVPTMSRVQL